MKYLSLAIENIRKYQNRIRSEKAKEVLYHIAEAIALILVMGIGLFIMGL